MNYWQMLDLAERHLADRRLRAAEDAFHAAVARRGEDARGVLLTESIPDGLRRAWRRLRRRRGPTVGRWEGRSGAFRRDFAAAALEVAGRASVQRDLDAGADPAATAGLLEEALFLAVDSRLATCRLPASDLLVALLRLAPATGRLPDRALLPEPASLPASVRLEMAELAPAALAAADPDERRGWTHHLLALLDDDPPEPWPPEARARRARAAAELADRHLDDPLAVAERWGACDHDDLPAARRHWARIRRLELLAGCDPRRPDVPDPTIARRLARSLPDVGGEAAVRLDHALAVVDYRAPRADPDRSWVSAAAAPDGTVRFVAWWGPCPRDVACWRPGASAASLQAWLAAADGRVVWLGDAPPAPLAASWPEPLPGRALGPLLEVLLEPWLPASGWSEDLARGFALARSGPWRQDWRPDLGLPELSPPGHDGHLRSEQDDVAAALRAGLLWLAIAHRLEQADPALRAGIAELGRRGHGTAEFLHRLAVLGAPDKAAVDAGFAPWTLPLLWTRPDPLDAAGEETGAAPPRPELAGQDVAVVVGGRPGPVMRAWGERDARWRIVLDRADRLGDLAALARESFGPVTLVPRDGRVHRLDAALARLESMLAADTAAGDDDLLPICHWLRLVETHNGDLLDHRSVRPRAAGVCPQFDRYAEAIADLPTEDVGLAGDGWGAQYGQRVRRSGMVAGLAEDLAAPVEVLDARWGVYDGSGASWVFLDSAAVHWRLRDGRDERIAALHGLLASRGGRHLSLIGSADLFPDALASWFDEVLASYGRPYHARFGDVRAPRLRLASAAPLPGSRLHVAAPYAHALTVLEAAEADTAVVPPADDVERRFWSEAANGAFGTAGWRLAGDGRPDQVRRLVIPQLATLAALAPPRPEGDDPRRWREADARRGETLATARRHAALEVAALLAQDVAVVEILDSRWWRWLTTAAGDPRDALAAAAAGEVELAPPAVARGAGLDEAVRSWLAAQGRVAGLLGDEAPADLAGAAPVEFTGLHLHAGEARGLWPSLAAACLAAWESGGRARGLLVIAETPPPGLAALVGGMVGPHPSSVDPEAPGPLGPLAWARPTDLIARIRAGHELADRDAVLVLDLDRMLPGDASAVEMGPEILAWLAAARADRIDLVGGHLGPAWAAFLGERLGGEVRVPGDAPGGWRRIRRGLVPRPERTCPHCGHVGTGAADGLVCAACGFDLSRPEAPADPVAESAARATVLLAQADLGRDIELEVWGAAEGLAAVRAAAVDRGAEADDAAPLRLALPDGRRWRLRPLDQHPAAAAGPSVLLRLPAGPERLRPQAPPADDHELTLLYDAVDLRRLADQDSRAGVDRLVRVLADERALLRGAPGHDRSGQATLTTWHLAWQAGLPEETVRRRLAELRWAARLADPAGAGSADGAPGLRVQVARRQIELQLGGLAEHVRAGLGALLGGSLAAASLTVTTAAGGDDDLLARQHDEFLALLAAPAWRDAWPRPPRLTYAAPAGAWFDARRRLSRLAPVEEATDAVAEILDAFASWCHDLLAEGSLVDVGYDVPLANVSRRDRAWLVLGQQLGFWSLSPAVGPDVIPLDEVRERLAPAVVDPGSLIARLLREQAAAADRWRARLAATPAGGVLASPATPEPPAPSRRWWRRGQRDPLDGPRREVAAFVTAPYGRTLVLAGAFGSGRLRSVLAGLAASEHGRTAEIWCPDVETAARAHLVGRGVRSDWRPDIQVAAAGDGRATVACRAPAERRPVVLVEVQRFPREVRYRLQEAAREPGVVMTVDPADCVAGEAWEDLFVATPRRDDVHRLDQQLAQARLPWELTRSCRDPEDGDQRTVRREQGSVEARHAETIDECAAAITSARQGGKLDDHVLVIAPHAEDVDLLARALGDRGWAAARRATVAPLLGPGVLEALAACADVHRERHGHWPDGGEAAGPPLLATLIPAWRGRGWRDWLRALPPAVADDAAEFLRHWQRSPWGEAAGASPTARRRLAGWVAEAGGGPGDRLAPATWRVWRRWLAAALDRRDLGPGVPTALLAAAAEPPSTPAGSVAYVCFGSEPPAVHRRSYAQATDRLLVLYQERSPLPGEADAAAAD